MLLFFKCTTSINQEEIKYFLLSTWLVLFMGAQTIKTRQTQGQSSVGGDGGGGLKVTWNHGLSSRTQKGCGWKVRDT